MGSEIIYIGHTQLIIVFIFIFIGGAASIYHSLNLEYDMIVGALRTCVQLFLLGYVLKVIFALNNMWLVLLIFLFMTFFAAKTVYNRVKDPDISFFIPVSFSMSISFFIVAFIVTAIVVRVDPWWSPRYFIPLGGMVIGNSMNAVAIALERLLNELRTKRHEIEMKLCFGANYKEASRDIVANAMKSGMIPSINSMMAVGIVFIPGMMTGQIIAGADPEIAIKYQIVVMLMLVGSTSISTLIVVLIVRKLCFGIGEQLLLRSKN
jgi:putative ABC transport system permease protein